MKFKVESQEKLTTYLLNRAHKMTLGWEACWPPYQPDSRVAKAWKFDMGDVKIHPKREEGSHVIL
jgi:hypothetical protein